MTVSAICKIKHEVCGQDAPIKHEVKPNALLASRQCVECSMLRIARARPCFNCSKELTHECLVKAYLFQLLSVRQLCHLG